MENQQTNQDVERQKICILLGLVIEMRHHQRTYFAHRREEDKRKSIAAEKRVDLYCMRLKMDKYKPIIDHPDQHELF